MSRSDFTAPVPGSFTDPSPGTDPSAGAAPVPGTAPSAGSSTSTSLGVAASGAPTREVASGAPTRGAATSGPVLLPHHRLVAYSVALELLFAVRAAQVRDPKLRDEALRSAKSACLNTAEGAGRVSRPDKARAFAVARAEAGEAAAAVEIAAAVGDAPAGASAEVNRLADRLVALLTGLIR
jgi:four helix bundle protein